MTGPAFVVRPDDGERTLALLDILDTPPEPEFDDIVTLATIICETPVALVSLIDRDRQWFKARIGFEACQTSLDHSVCALALADTSPGVFVIPDLRTDPRTRGNPLVAGEPHLRFYAGARLIHPDGQGIGMLCVLDHQPRPHGLSQVQATGLLALANQVMSLLTLRRTSAALLDARRNTADRAIQAGETRLRMAVEAGQIGEWELDLDTNVSIRALRHDQIFGHREPVEEWGIDTFMAHVLPEDRAATEDAFTRAATTGAGWNFQCRIRRADDGEVRWISAFSAPQRDASGRAIKLFGMVQDITEQKTAEERLRALNENLEQQVAERTRETRLYGEIVQSSAAPICAFDTDYRLIAFNRAHSDEFFRIFGHRAQLGEVFPNLFPAAQAKTIRDLMERALSGDTFTVTEAFGDLDLAQPTWEVSYSPLRDEGGCVVGAFHHARDISIRLRTQAELATTQEALRQAQKMEAVGQLTGGLAHDFNNLLAGITGALELMQIRMQQGRFTELGRYMAAAQGAARRAAALTHRLLAFSRRQTLDPKPTDVNRLALDMQELIQRTVGPGIPVQVVGASGVWPALVDPPQLENALLNLCINARDAMPHGGRITIETANKWLDDRAAQQQDMPEGQYLTLSVTDTGTGMSPEVIARVFEPFFTTKPMGEGTGLGLSMIYGFAKQSGGQVRIYSEVGQGTTVSIYLPRYHGEVADEDGALALPKLPRSEQGETVLIVDDEPTVRMLVTEILEDLGHLAIEAGDSATGLKVLQSDVRIDLLVTDVGLPGGMNGRQMADAARVVRPELKVLFITGYAENAALGHGQLAPGMAVMTKPFAIDAMAARIRSMLTK